MRVVFIGAVNFSERALARILETHAQVVGVCTLEHSPTNADHRDLSPLCEAHGVPWTYAPRINSAETLSWIAAKQPDVIFCFGWSRLLGRPLLELAPRGVVGYHPAALPANRGRHPLIWALALGLTETASTFFLMDEGADRGDIISQERVTIEDADDAGTLYEKMTQCAFRQIDQVVRGLSDGTMVDVPQDHRCANVWRKRGAADGCIDWRMSARTIHNLVRALAKPYVGAHFVHEGREIKVWKTEVLAGVPLNAEPGKVLAVDERGPTVKCGEQSIRLLVTDPFFAPARGAYL